MYFGANSATPKSVSAASAEQGSSAGAIPTDTQGLPNVVKRNMFAVIPEYHRQGCGATIGRCELPYERNSMGSPIRQKFS